MLKPDYLDFDKDGNKTEPMKEAIKDRNMKNDGGLLTDDREQYGFGGMLRAQMAGLNLSKKGKSVGQKGAFGIPRNYKDDSTRTISFFGNEFEVPSVKPSKQTDYESIESYPFAEGGSVDASMNERNTWQEGGDVDEQMSELMGPQQPTMVDEEMPMNEEPMESDSEMEDNYLDFIIDEALSEEEEDMLMSKLEQDEELSMLFDKVIEVASEFAGSGPVEGPGTGVSDSIPARLSDGEFVFTAKAVEEIGADNLMAMMKEAEMKADERQGMANGGPLEEERVVLESTQEPVVQKIEVAKETVDETARPIQDTGEQELSMSLRANMLDPSKRYVRS